MTQDEIDDLAYGIIEDYLDEGPEYESIVWAVEDNTEDPTNDDFKAVQDKVREYLTELKRKF